MMGFGNFQAKDPEPCHSGQTVDITAFSGVRIAWNFRVQVTVQYTRFCYLQYTILFTSVSSSSMFLCV